MYKRNPLNYFARPFLARMPLRMVTLFLLTALYIGFDEVSFAESVTDIAFWIFVIPAVFFFVRSFMVGLRYKDGTYTYRSYFRKRRIAAQDIDHFWLVGEESWAEDLLGTLGEYYSFPVAHLKSGDKVAFSACSGWMTKVERKVTSMNRISDPDWTVPEHSEEDVTPGELVKMFLEDFTDSKNEERSEKS